METKKKSRSATVIKRASLESVTEDEKKVLKRIAQLASTLDEGIQQRYFRREFKVEYMKKFSVAYDVQVPKQRDLVLGKCNYPAQLTVRTLLSKENVGCRVLDRCKNSKRFFCHNHEYFANLHNLPIEGDQNAEKPIPQEQTQTQVHTPAQDDMVIDASLCEFILGCDNSSTYKGYCDKHQYLTDELDGMADPLEVDELKKLDELLIKIQSSVTTLETSKIIELVTRRRQLSQRNLIGFPKAFDDLCGGG